MMDNRLTNWKLKYLFLVILKKLMDSSTKSYEQHNEPKKSFDT